MNKILVGVMVVIALLRLVDQSANGSRWVSLGTYRCCGVLPYDHVSLSDVSYEPYVSRLIAFDAVNGCRAGRVEGVVRRSRCSNVQYAGRGRCLSTKTEKQRRIQSCSKRLF